MIHMKDRLVLKRQFRDFSALVLHHFVVLIIIPHSCGAHVDLIELICSHQPIVALVGDDVILPCQLQPPISADSETVLWTRHDLDPVYVHYHQDGRLMFENQNPSYFLRTRLFMDDMTRGNVSMKIFKVKLSDAGTYFCLLPSMKKEASIQLTVGVVSMPVIDFIETDGRKALQCESEGWYPEPELIWLDGEGHVLSAGPTETVRDPDGLYNINSRLTVEERHGNSFTCRVQQKDINQTRETQIHVPDDFITAQLSFLLKIWICTTLLCTAAIIIMNTVTRFLMKKKNIHPSSTTYPKSGHGGKSSSRGPRLPFPALTVGS